MSFAKVEKPSAPNPRYKNTVVCPHCHAEYTPQKWVGGVDLAAGTTLPSRISHEMTIDENTCPGCFRKRDDDAG